MKKRKQIKKNNGIADAYKQNAIALYSHLLRNCHDANNFRLEPKKNCLKIRFVVFDWSYSRVFEKKEYKNYHIPLLS